MPAYSFFRVVNFRFIIFIIIISSATGLVFNYLNPQGIILFNLPEDKITEVPEGSGPIEFVQPIFISHEEAHLLFGKKIIFIDIRSSSGFNEGNIPNAVNLPFDSVDNTESVLGSYTKDTPFVIYGSKEQADMLSKTADRIFHTGFKRIYLFTGGYEEWTANNYEVSR